MQHSRPDEKGLRGGAATPSAARLSALKLRRGSWSTANHHPGGNLTAGLRGGRRLVALSDVGNS